MSAPDSCFYSELYTYLSSIARPLLETPKRPISHYHPLTHFYFVAYSPFPPHHFRRPHRLPAVGPQPRRGQPPDGARRLLRVPRALQPAAPQARVDAEREFAAVIKICHRIVSSCH